MNGMNAKQTEWFNRMSAEMNAVTEAWQYDRALAYRLYTDELRQKVALACKKLGIDLPQAWDMDGWDGEENAQMVTTRRQLSALV